MTNTFVLTRITGALIDVNLAIDAVKPGKAFAGVHADEVLAGGSVLAGARLTLVYFDFTVDSWFRRGKVRMEL